MPTAAYKKGGLQRKRATFGTRQEAIADMMVPIGKKGGGTITINPKTKRKEYVPSDREKVINAEVVRTAGINPKDPYTTNFRKLEDKAEKLRNNLDAFISSRNAPVNKQALKTGLANKVNSIDEDTFLVGNSRDHAITMYAKAQKLIDASDGTAMGILQVRRDFDAWVRQSRPKVFDSDYEHAAGVALRVIRDHMNDSVAVAVKSPSVKDALTKQHHTLSAAELLEGKAYAEADGALGRMIGKLEDKTGTRLPTTPQAQAMTIKTIGLGLVGGLGIFKAYRGLKWLGSPGGKAWLKQVREVAKQYPFIQPEVLVLTRLASGLGPTEE